LESNPLLVHRQNDLRQRYRRGRPAIRAQYQGGVVYFPMFRPSCRPGSQPGVDDADARGQPEAARTGRLFRRLLVFRLEVF
jgi:hypothetical protein